MQFMNRNYDDEIHSPVRGLMLAVPVSILFWLIALATCYGVWMLTGGK